MTNLEERIYGIRPDWWKRDTPRTLAECGRRMAKVMSEDEVVKTIEEIVNAIGEEYGD